MNNINEYSELDFRNRFENSEIHKQLKQDFTHIIWEKCLPTIIPYRLFETGLTPRQWAGESLFYVVPFYYIEKLLETNPTTIYDIGCGWNVFKKYIPNIIGIDKMTENPKLFYADKEGQFDDEFVSTNQGQFESAFSINSLHFRSLADLKKVISDFVSTIKSGGRGFLTLDIKRMLEQTSDEETIRLFSTNTPTIEQYDKYVREELAKVDCKYIVVDVDLSILDEYMNGNIRIVFER
jgi:hypothetical protein